MRIEKDEVEILSGVRFGKAMGGPVAMLLQNRDWVNWGERMARAGDGETTVIGGILQITRNESQAGLPWLSKIPVLGYLFRKDTNSVQNRELLIFITPKIMKQEPIQAKAS